MRIRGDRLGKGQGGRQEPERNRRSCLAPYLRLGSLGPTALWRGKARRKTPARSGSQLGTKHSGIEEIGPARDESIAALARPMLRDIEALAVRLSGPHRAPLDSESLTVPDHDLKFAVFVRRPLDARR